MSTNTLVVKEPGRSYILETSDQLNAALYTRQALEHREAANLSREAAAASEAAAAASERAAQSSEEDTQALQQQTAASQEAAAASESAAAASAALADQHRLAAASSETAANDSEIRARQWASEVSGQELEPGLYSARHYAEQARADVSSAMVYRGVWDPNSGAFPDDDHTGSLYKVSIEGTLDGETYRVGDQIVYNGASWDHIDNTETVTSVGGNVGDVTDAQLLAAVSRVDGAGSGLDADRLDGRDSTDFASAAQGRLADSATQPEDLAAVATSGAYTDLSGTPANATASVPGLMSGPDKAKLDGIEAGATGDQTDTEILEATKRVDGTGSGLDADMLDGNHATDFATAAQGARADSAVQPTDMATTTQNGLMSAPDKGKLDAIESGATGDQTDAEILAAINRVGGTGSGLDADTLDGEQLVTIENRIKRYADDQAFINAIIFG